MIRRLWRHGRVVGLQVGRRRLVLANLIANSCLLAGCQGAQQCTARARTQVRREVAGLNDDELMLWLRTTLNDPDDGRAFKPEDAG